MNGIKTKMGTNRLSSSHSPSTTVVVNGVRLLLLWPAASTNTGFRSAAPGCLVLLFMAKPSGCPFSHRSMITGRSVVQALLLRIPKEAVTVPGKFPDRNPSVINPGPCDSNHWKNVSGFDDLLNTEGLSSPRSDFGSPDMQTRRSDRNGSCFN